MVNVTFGDKLAKWLRKKDYVCMQELKYGFYVTDTSFVVELPESIYNHFVNAWNNYKSTTDIDRHLEHYALIEGEYSDHPPNISYVLQKVYNENDYKEANISDVCLRFPNRYVRLIYNDDQVIGIDDCYSWMIQDIYWDKCLISSENKAVIFQMDGRILLLIMPVQISDCMGKKALLDIQEVV